MVGLDDLSGLFQPMILFYSHPNLKKDYSVLINPFYQRLETNRTAFVSAQ